jgi:hypothetical protein
VSLVGGNVSVDLDANGDPLFSGSGLALEWARATILAALSQLPPLPSVGSTAPPYRPERPASATDRKLSLDARRLLFQEKARDANAVAPMLVAYLQANAQVDLAQVRARVAGVSVGRTPNPNAADVPINPPASAVDLPLVGAPRIT